MKTNNVNTSSQFGREGKILRKNHRENIKGKQNRKESETVIFITYDAV